MATIETTTAPFVPAGTLSVKVPAIGQANLEQAEVPTIEGFNSKTHESLLEKNSNHLYQHLNLDNTVTSSDVIAGSATITLTANKTDRYTGAQVNNFTVALGTPVANQINTYTMTFATGTSVPVPTWPTSPSAIKWAGGVPALEVNSLYKIIFTMNDSNEILGEISKF